jgi:hypothetical protein
MELKNFKVDEYEFVFICEEYSNSREWGHKVELKRKGFSGDYITLERTKIRYYNRTWESYKFQSAMLKAVRKYIDGIKEIIEIDYRRENNITRLTAKRREVLNEIFENSESIKIYEKLYKEVRGY